MKKWIAQVATLTALASQPGIASQTACTFSGGKEPQYFEIEFIGYGDASPMIVFSASEFASGKRVPLKPADYSFKRFSQSTATIDLEFRNPRSDLLPPSFSLLARPGGRAQLKMGSTIVDGKLECGH